MAFLILTGKMFHNRGAITEKALSPAHFFETGTTKLVLPEERVLIAPSAHLLTIRQFWMYWRESPSTDMYTYNKVLYIILSPTGNQCSWLSKGDTWIAHSAIMWGSCVFRVHENLVSCDVSYKCQAMILVSWIETYILVSGVIIQMMAMKWCHNVFDK